MAADCILSELRHAGQLLHLTLNAPKGNILDSAMIDGIESALDRHEADANLKAIVFEGAGKHFCFGASVEEHRAEQAPAMLARFHGLFRRLATQGIPTAAVVRGQCLGGGLELASYCTWIFSSRAACFGQPEIKLAVFPPMASILLPWRVGAGSAMDLCVSGRSIDAAEALRIGLVNNVSDVKGDPGSAFEAFFAEQITPLSASSVRFAERAVRLSLRRMLDEELPRIEALYLSELMTTHDANEGIAAFLEKRPAAYTGNVPGHSTGDGALLPSQTPGE